MRKAFCEYCGQPIENDCDCWIQAQEDYERFIEDYENDPVTCAGWAQQDVIDLYRMER